MRVRLGDYIKEYSAKNKNNEDIPVYSVSNSLGFCKDYFGKDVASKNKTTYKIVPRGCFAYNPSRINVGSVDWQNEEERVIVSPLYNVFSVSPLLDQQYLLYYLKSNVTLSRIRAVASGSVRDNLKLSMLYEFPIDLISLDKQYDVVSILNAVQKIIGLYQKELSNLDELVRARFVEMFGDPVLNEKGWITKPLIDMGNCKNGMNFHYNENGYEVKCLGVGDFKDLSIINNIESLQTVSLNEMPTEEYMLRDNDIVFVRSNGNKALVGRSIVIYPGDVPTTFSGFCIRYRKYDDSIIVPYLLHVLKTDSFRNKMIGRGANIQNLNQQILANLIIPVPPLELQNQFASFVEEIDKSRLRELLAIKHIKLLLNDLFEPP